jgi:F-type H+-transporting ATPase subunit delta
MPDYRAASRYAKSLLQLSRDQGILEEIQKDMVMIDEACEANRELALVLKSPIINHYKKNQILDKIFGEKINPLTKAFYELIGRKGREFIFHQITKEFRKQYLLLKGIEKVSVTTTFPLDDNLRKQVKDIASEISNKKPQLEEIVDKDIVGGFVLNMDGRRIDASVKTKLRKLEKELIK